jgi:hypothetical protein
MLQGADAPRRPGGEVVIPDDVVLLAGLGGVDDPFCDLRHDVRPTWPRFLRRLMSREFGLEGSGKRQRVSVG